MYRALFKCVEKKLILQISPLRESSFNMTRWGRGGGVKILMGAPKMFRCLDTQKGGPEKNQGGLQKFVCFNTNRKGEGAPKKLNHQRGGLLKFQAFSFNIFIPPPPTFVISNELSLKEILNCTQNYYGTQKFQFSFRWFPSVVQSHTVHTGSFIV